MGSTARVADEESHTELASFTLVTLFYALLLEHEWKRVL